MLLGNSMSHISRAFLVLLASNNACAQSNVSVFFETEVGYSFELEEIRKAESTLKFEINGEFENHIAYTVIPKVRFDFENSLSTSENRLPNYSSWNGPVNDSRNAVLELSEAYMEFEAFDVNWVIGKQQVVWGVADGLKVLDVINPQDLRELNLDKFEDSRIPTWMINAEIELPIFDESALQVLVIPDMTFNRLADNGSDFDVTSPLFNPRLDAGVQLTGFEWTRPSGELEAGLRWLIYLEDGWDLSFIYFNHFHDVPAIYLMPSGPEQIKVELAYQRNNLYGMTATSAFGDWVLRLELGYNSSNYQISSDLSQLGVRNTRAVNSVLGIDYHGFDNMLVSYQWFQTTLMDFTDDILLDRVNMQHTLTVRQDLWQENLFLNWFALFDHQGNDGELRGEVTYRYSDNLSLWVGVDVFYGDREGLFGQFNDNDRLVLGFKYGL